MKRIFLISTLAGFFMPVLAGGFTIHGVIPGLPEGTIVKLVGREKGSAKLAATESKAGEFTLEGEVKSPTISEIRILYENGGVDMVAFGLMVDNVDMTVETSHVDSIPPSFYFGHGGLLKEQNVKVTGGRAQAEFAEYNAVMLPYRIAAKKAHFDLYVREDRKKLTEAEKDSLSKIYAAAQYAEQKASRDFAFSHPHYSVSGSIIAGLLSSPFSFTDAELDNLAGIISGGWDSARVAEVNNGIEKSRRFVKGAPFTDFAALDPESAEHKVMDLHTPGKLMLIDFWASWCGPCRAAIPHVRELWKKYSDRLDVMAVSMDSDEKAWREAMEDERMEWTQLWTDKERVNPIVEAYDVRSIPYLLLVDTDGKIVFAGSDKDALSEEITRLLD